MAAPNSLVAVFESDGRALEAARRVRNLGVDDRSIRLGEPFDKLASARGTFVGWLLRAFGLERSEETLAAARGTTLAVPDSGEARRVLLTSGSLRVDVVSAAGDPVATLASNDPGLRHTPGEIARPARHERRRA